MNAEETKQFLARYLEPRIPGTDIAFHDLNPGDRFQHKEILTHHKYIVTYKEGNVMKYEKDGWSHTVLPDGKMWNTIVERI